MASRVMVQVLSRFAGVITRRRAVNIGAAMSQLYDRKNSLVMRIWDKELGFWDMASTTWSPDVRHPVYATRVLCEVANERGVATRDLLAGTHIGPADLDDPETLVTAWDEIVAVRRLLARLPDDAGVGTDVGSRFTLTHVGLMGFAAMSCATLRELFTIAMRYFALTMLHIDVQLFEGADDCLLELNVGHLPADVRRFFIERDVAGIIATVSGFAYPVVQRYADRVVAELSVEEDALRPLLALVPIENVT
jgi:Arabinose-binding domain of AraC transcription regulator, N-term